MFMSSCYIFFCWSAVSEMFIMFVNSTLWRQGGWLAEYGYIFSWLWCSPVIHAFVLAWKVSYMEVDEVCRGFTLKRYLLMWSKRILVVVNRSLFVLLNALLSLSLTFHHLVWTVSWFRVFRSSHLIDTCQICYKIWGTNIIFFAYEPLNSTYKKRYYLARKVTVISFSIVKN